MQNKRESERERMTNKITGEINSARQRSVKQRIKTSLSKMSPSLLKKAMKISNHIYEFRRDIQVGRLADQISNYYRSSEDPELRRVAAYVFSNGIHMFPYEFRLKYASEAVQVCFDQNIGYPYVLMNAGRVYFPKETQEAEIQSGVATALMEQDEKSPHRYLSENTKLKPDDVAVLVGASDGIFCLSIVDRIRKAYLFEPDDRWEIPLKYTFAPHNGKVEVVKKFVSSIDKDDRISLDTFFSKRGEYVNYLQADMEGGEKDLLIGARNLLKNSNLELSICCYHREKDEKELSEMLLHHGFRVEYSAGYMLMWMQVPCRKPFFRKGIIYASK